MITNNLKSLIIESNKYSGITKHFIYNKYASFLTKNKIDNFRKTFYFLTDNFKEELKFIKKEQLVLLIKLLLSYNKNYILSFKKTKNRFNQIYTSQESYNYIMNYFKNELELHDITKQNIIFNIYSIRELYKFIKFMDKNYFSLIEAEVNDKKFTVKILAFFYGEKFDIYEIIKNYGGEIIE